MFLELGLENFVLIKSAVLPFSPGLTVLTGETGAGKSLLVQALKIVLGAKATSQLIRTGAEQATVQAMLEVHPETEPILQEMGIPHDGELVIRRIIPKNGRGRIYVNGALVGLQDLKRLTDGLVSLASQHEYQELLRREKQGLWLDRFAGLEGTEHVARLYQELRALRVEYQRAVEQERIAAAELGELRREIAEIDALSPVPGEEEDLEQELQVLRAAATLRSLGESCYSTLYADKGSVQEQLAECRKNLERMAELDPRLEKTSKELDSAAYQAEEAARALRDYLRDLPTDLSRLDQIEERLYSLRNFQRRYGRSIEEALDYRREIDARIQAISCGGDELTALKDRIGREEQELLSSALELSRRRREAAARLSLAVQAGLSDLNLLKTEFRVEVDAPEGAQVSDVGPRGLDHVNFLFSPNVGEPARALAAIASGGELSRVMLAIRTALVKKVGVETVVFDEIDAGIGGEVAGRVGIKLKALSSRGQVVVVTHFPHIAALADQHLSVGKKVEGGTTVTSVRELHAADERLEEITRMLGGDTTAARAYAKRLLQASTEAGMG
jgi:DNA repair protein RecN (Recombination protein N)